MALTLRARFARPISFQTKLCSRRFCEPPCRGERIRTSDPLNPIDVRYQAALRPDVYVKMRDRRWVDGVESRRIRIL